MSESADPMESSDSGGVGAKRGFRYQDYAAALYVLKMLRDKRLRAVRCEVTDDIDLEYDEYVEFVQVKTTDADSKWNISELCETSPPKKVPGKKSVKPQDSILHRSLASDKSAGTVSKFRILTPRDVRASLSYLRIRREDREGKPGKATLLAALSKSIGGFTSGAGNNVEYWIDNVEWEVVPSVKQLELECRNAILQGAADQNIYLNPNRDVAVILDQILSALVEKSATSRKLGSIKDKTYSREDFLNWFTSEINACAGEQRKFSKVYLSGASSRPAILLKFIDLSASSTHAGMGVEQGYHKGKYRFEYIADALTEWLPEILLRPNELADMDGTNLLRSLGVIAARFANETEEFEKFLGRALLHATIRHYSKSQPIPATLYIEHSDSLKVFENVTSSLSVIARTNSGLDLAGSLISK